MAEAEKGNHIREETLKPFFQRASEAEERLSRLEAAVASKKDAGSEEHLKTISELQSKLESANAELVSERKKAGNLAAENAKLQYRIKHLVQAVEEADHKLEQANDEENYFRSLWREYFRKQGTIRFETDKNL